MLEETSGHSTGYVHRVFWNSSRVSQGEFLFKLHFFTHFTQKWRIEKLYLLGTQSTLNLGTKIEVIWLDMEILESCHLK